MKKPLALLAALLLSTFSLAAHAATSWSTQDYDLYPGDFNGDGKTDLLYVARDVTKPSGIALSDGNAPSIPLQSWVGNYLGIPWGGGTYEPIVADFNGDGRADVLMQRNSPGNHFLLLSNVEGRLVGISQNIGNTNLGITWSADQHKIVAGDFNGDGKADLLFQATNPSIVNAVVLADANGFFTANPTQTWNDGFLGFKWSTANALIHVGDFNGDGRKDLLLQARPKFISIDSKAAIPIPLYPPNMNGVIRSQGGASHFQQAGAQAFSRNAFGADFSPLISTIVVGDFNGDGRADIIVQSRHSGRSSFLLNGNASGSSFSTGTALANNVTLSGDAFRLITGNFDGIGAAGIYLQATSPAGTNLFAATITGGTIATTAHDLTNVTGAIAPATATGVTPGTFAVGNDGTANYSIPIVIPPGIAGVQPQLALTYSSQRGNGWLGIGWDISGLSQITRCRKTFAQDGVAGAVELSMNDKFCLDGVRLRRESGSTYGAAGSVYRTELESFSRITANGTAGNGPAWFKVEAKNGLIFEYGNTNDSRIESLSPTASTTPRTWALNKVSDRAGNTMTVSYMEDTINGSFHPVEILYTSNAGANVSAAYKVRFEWETRPSADTLSGYFAGGLVREAFRLNRIETMFNDPAVGGFRVVRKYQLSYNLSASTGRSRLAAVQECEFGGNCLSPTVIGWQEGQSGLSAATVIPPPLDFSSPFGSPPLAIDINGDGRDDLIQLGVYLSLANAEGFDPPMSLLSVTPGGVLAGGGGNNPADYNGDGKGDLLSTTGSSPSEYQVLQSTGTSFTPILTGIAAGSTTPSAADVDGDGRPDLILSNADATPSTIAVAFNRTSGFVQPVTVFTSQQATSVVRIADFNGDGRADLLVRIGTTGSARLLLSQGTSYTDTALVLPSWFTLVSADINGDGVDDATYNCGSNRCIRFGAAGAPNVGLGPERNTGQPASAVNAALLAIDWDSDGKTDLLQGGPTSGNSFQLLRSTGESFAPPIDPGIPISTGTSSISLVPADTNGDGLRDVFFTSVVSNGSSPISTTSLRVHRPGAADLVTSVADGFGNATNVTYAALTDANVYTKGNGATFPQADIQRPMQVVKRYTQTDGTGGSFAVNATYSGARLDQSGRGFLGFASRRLIDSRDNIHVYEYYRQDFPFVGALAQSDELQPDNATLISQVINSFTSTTLGTGNDQRHLVTTTQSVTKRYEVGGTKNGVQIAEQTTTVAYDGFANPKDIIVSTTDKDSASPFFNQVWQTRTLNSFANNTTSWCLGRPIQTSVGDTLPDGTARGRNVAFTVDSGFICRTTQQVTEPNGGALKVTRNIGYDSCGNVGTVGVIGANPDGSAMTARNTVLDYGARCVFPEKVTNALGQVTTANYRYDIGAQSFVKDPNGLTTSAIYDNFGRLKRLSRPDGTATDQYIFGCTAANNFCGVPDLRFQVQSVERDANNGTITTATTFFDSLGRERISQAERALSGVSYVSTTYDNLGRPITRSRPYSTTSNGFSRNTYDLLDRLTKVELVRPDASVDRTGTIAYAGGTVSVTDAKSNMKQRVFDPIGSLRRVTDASGMTQYDYAPFQNLQRVIDPAGNTTNIAYNIRGFRTSLADPDRGNSTFTFNSLGELLSQTDARNQTVSFTYDALSRPLTRTEPEGVTTWTWDTAAGGIGKIARVSSPGGYAEDYLYDALSRPTQTAYTEDTAYQVNYEYNNQGLIDAVTYPTSTSNYRLKLKYAYSRGSLLEVRDFNAPSTVFWRLNATDDSNNPTDETLGNDGTFTGVRLTSSFNPLTGELNTRRSGTGSSTTNLQNLSYQWDLTGNLKQRQDVLQNLTEVFNYDNLDRLTGSTLNGTTNLSVAFDALGNITTKSDVGTYNYTTPQTGCSYYTHTQPHAVRAAGSNIYCYDQNGNMTRRAGSTISYTSYDLPSQITQGTNSSQFSYGANRQRWRQVATYGGTTETTIYVGGLLDKVTRGSVTEFRHYIATGSDASAIHTRRSDGTTDTYYVTADHLGSTDVIVDRTGTVKLRESFTAYGARRGSNWSESPSASDLTQIANITRDGFTGHEHLDNLNLIHMNGRVYDPTLGRFLSADPIVQEPENSQSLNRYSYVINSPLSFTDPSGFYFGPLTSLTIGGGLIGGIGGAGGPDFGGGTSVGSFFPSNGFIFSGSFSFSFGGPTIGIGGSFGPALPTTLNTVKGADGFVTGRPNGNDRVLGQTVTDALYVPGIAPIARFNLGFASPIVNGTLNIINSVGNELVNGIGVALSPFDYYAGELFTLERALPPGLGTAAQGVTALGGNASRLIRAARAANAAGPDAGVVARTALAGCFVAGTPVHTERGLVPIEEIRAGDLVWAMDEKTGEVALQRVKQRFVIPDKPVIDVALTDDEGRVETVRATVEHPFWTQRGWVGAEHLSVTDRVMMRSGSWVSVSSVRPSGTVKTVYNFEVEQFHTYFVGSHGLLVHNTSQISSADARKATDIIEQLRNSRPDLCQNKACVEFANAAEEALSKAGIKGRRVRIENGGAIGFDGKSISDNGVHEFIDVDGRVFDNLTTTGREDFLNRLGVSNPRLTVTERGF